MPAQALYSLFTLSLFHFERTKICPRYLSCLDYMYIVAQADITREQSLTVGTHRSLGQGIELCQSCHLASTVASSPFNNIELTPLLHFQEWYWLYQSSAKGLHILKKSYDYQDHSLHSSTFFWQEVTKGSDVAIPSLVYDWEGMTKAYQLNIIYVLFLGLNRICAKSANIRTSRDWFSGHTQVVRMGSSVFGSLTRRFIIFALFLLSR